MGIRKPKARVEQTEENGKRLLAAGRAVFAKRGYHGATLDQVAQAAGLTKGAVYARFDGKADLFLALLAERIDERVAELRALPEPSSPEQAADDIFRQWLERSRDPAWTLLVLEFRVAAARERSLNARYAALHRRIIDAVAERIVRAAHSSGTALSRDPRTVAEVGLALANGLLLERAVTANPDELDAATVEANQGIVSALRGVRPARGIRRAQ